MRITTKFVHDMMVRIYPGEFCRTELVTLAWLGDKSYRTCIDTKYLNFVKEPVADLVPRPCLPDFLNYGGELAKAGIWV